MTDQVMTLLRQGCQMTGDGVGVWKIRVERIPVEHSFVVIVDADLFRVLRDEGTIIRTDDRATVAFQTWALNPDWKSARKNDAAAPTSKMSDEDRAAMKKTNAALNAFFFGHPFGPLQKKDAAARRAR
jgi:hypothetical protein